jgi:hypothetical protein
MTKVVTIDFMNPPGDETIGARKGYGPTRSTGEVGRAFRNSEQRTAGREWASGKRRLYES